MTAATVRRPPRHDLLEPSIATFWALGTLAAVAVGDPPDLPTAMEVVVAEIAAADAAASRFRDDSDLSRLNRSAGGPAIDVSPWLVAAVITALEAAEATDGLVDPSVGSALVALGYDRDFAEVPADGSLTVTFARVPGWRSVDVDPGCGRIRLPAGVRLDLGATAKALAADRAAARAAERIGTGVLVSLGGDIAVAGPPPEGGWRVLVTDRADTAPATGAGQTVAITRGGLATSGIAARQWTRAGRRLHHLIDPRTGMPAAGPWRTISVASPSCVDANVAATGAMIVGPDARTWLADRAVARGLHARLVSGDGRVTMVRDWPTDTGESS